MTRPVSVSCRCDRYSPGAIRRFTASFLWVLQRKLWVQVALGLGVFPVAFAPPALAAERIYFSYGVLERSVSVESLEIYAREGRIEGDLRAYARYATPEQLAQLRAILQARAEIDPLAVSQFLYTDQGETLLERAGNLIETEANLNGFYAIRSALILAAASPEGLTPINVLRKFPVYGIRIQINRTLNVVEELEQVITQTNQAVVAIENQAAIEAAAEPDINFDELLDLRRAGPYSSQRETITLGDRRRDRVFLADVYLPTAGGAPLANAPVVVVSHGLGSDRTTYAYLAQHLASHGFAVALPEHPGSNAAQLEALLEGRASEVTAPDEFIDRPLDVKYLLNDLQRRSRFDPLFQGRLDLEQVAVIGQSFGGYTALALAGAPINLEQLRQDCPPNDSFNLSLLLQCRALDITRRPNLRDERIKAIIAINAVGSSVLGQESLSRIDVPVMLVGGNADTVTPALLEQIRPFTWLNTPNRYLLLMRGSTHFSTIGTSDIGEVVTFPREVIGPNPVLAQTYLNAMSLAFLQTYLVEDTSYRQYLGASYANSISQSPIPLRLVRFLTAAQLAEGAEPDTAAQSNRNPGVQPGE
jgi:predicted dienelactone hydrolase